MKIIGQHSVRNTLNRLVLGLSLALSLSLFTDALAAPVVNFRVYSSLTGDNNSAHYIWFKRFQDNLDKKYSGQIKLNYFPNAMLGKEADAAQQVRVGAINMMIAGSSIWATLVPEIGVLDLGYLFNDYQQVGTLLDGPSGTLLSDMMMKKANVKVLGWGYNLGSRNIYTKKQLTRPADLKELKIRVLPAPKFIDTLNNMGAVAIPMPGGEVYSGLQMGVIDGVENDAATVLASKYYEIIKFATLTQHIFNPIVVVINKASFDNIPENMRADFLAAAKEATEYERGQSMMLEKKAIEQLEQKGVKFSTIDRDAFRQQVKPVWDDFVKRYPDIKPVIAAVNEEQGKAQQ